jgi:hypothetical protein
VIDAFKDGFALGLVALGFVAGAIVHACIAIWRTSVPDDVKKADEEHAASVDQFPMDDITFLIVLIGLCGCAAIVAWSI